MKAAKAGDTHGYVTRPNSCIVRRTFMRPRHLFLARNQHRSFYRTNLQNAATLGRNRLLFFPSFFNFLIYFLSPFCLYQYFNCSAIILPIYLESFIYYLFLVFILEIFRLCDFFPFDSSCFLLSLDLIFSHFLIIELWIFSSSPVVSLCLLHVTQFLLTLGKYDR
jgi:hypothetical protein